MTRREAIYAFILALTLCAFGFLALGDDPAVFCFPPVCFKKEGALAYHHRITDSLPF